MSDEGRYFVLGVLNYKIMHTRTSLDMLVTHDENETILVL